MFSLVEDGVPKFSLVEEGVLKFSLVEEGVLTFSLVEEGVLRPSRNLATQGWALLAFQPRRAGFRDGR
jgi:hypothetical protein